MLSQPSGLFGWFARHFFDQVQLDPKTAERLRGLPEQGQLVYIMRTRSLLDYLFFNHLYLQIGIPLAQFSNGIDLSLFRGPKSWFVGLWERLRFRSSGKQATDLLGQVIKRGRSALLFMKRQTLALERQANPGFIERLVKLQRERKRPIFLLPQLISWPRRPPSRRHGLMDILFGTQEAQGRLRKIGQFLLYYRSASVRLGEPINLQEVLAQHEGWSDERIARKLRRVLFIHLGHEALAIHGPALKPGGMIRREILERKRFQTELKRLARQIGMRAEVASEQAERYLREIAAAWNYEIILSWDKLFLRTLFTRVFQGVEVDAEELRRVKEAAKLSRSAPLVLIPSHKSHADYLLISWALLQNEFIPPHIAAGANLSFFPLGPLLRRGGAFFMRRSFHGLPLYKLVFKHYIWKLMREGYPLEFFIEGGRSRTGKLLPPKLGMMGMLLEGISRGEYKDLQFIPINLSYERVVATTSYRRELTGASKKAESVGGVVKASKILRYRYGRIFISFEKPVRLSEYLRTRGKEDLSLLSVEEMRSTTRGLAYHIMRRIQDATVITPSTLVGAVLLSHDRRGISGARLRERVGFLVNLLLRRDARMSRSIQHTLEQHGQEILKACQRSERAGCKARGEALGPLVDEAMLLLKRLVQTVERAEQLIYIVPEKARIELDYYRNGLLGILAPDALIATVLRSHEIALPRAQLAEECQRLTDLFRLEFVFETNVSFEEVFDRSLERMKRDHLLREREELIYPIAPLTLEFLRGLILHLVEGYWIAIDALRALETGPKEEKAWLDWAREHGESEFLEGDIRRAEAVSMALFRNALKYLQEEEVIQVRERHSGRKSTRIYQLAEEISAEDLAFRRDDLGVYLVSRHENLPQPAAERPERVSTAQRPEDFRAQVQLLESQELGEEELEEPESPETAL